MLWVNKEFYIVLLKNFRFKLAKDVNLEEIVKTCPNNITGADFYGLCSNTWMAAARKLIKKIEKGVYSNYFLYFL